MQAVAQLSVCNCTRLPLSFG